MSYRIDVTHLAALHNVNDESPGKVEQRGLL